MAKYNDKSNRPEDRKDYKPRPSFKPVEGGWVDALKPGDDEVPVVEEVVEEANDPKYPPKPEEDIAIIEKSPKKSSSSAATKVKTTRSVHIRKGPNKLSAVASIIPVDTHLMIGERTGDYARVLEVDGVTQSSCYIAWAFTEEV